MLKRTGEAVWMGQLRGGRGQLTTASKVLAGADYAFGTRFGGDRGTNPEELIAAAHAGCYAMAFAFGLESAGFPPERIHVDAALTIDLVDEFWTVLAIHLEVTASVPGISNAEYASIAEKARAGCLVTRLVRADVTLDARLDV